MHITASEVSMVYPQGMYDVRRDIGVRVWFYVTAVVWPIVGIALMHEGYLFPVQVASAVLAILMVCSWGAWNVREPKR